MAISNCHLQRYRQGIQTLRSLRLLASTRRAPLLLIQLAAIAEVAAACFNELPDETRHILYGNGKDRGFYSLAGELSILVASFPKLSEVSGKISAECLAFEKGGCRDGSAIVDACRLVP
jgi:hypothetical protein